jgi:hypothetical protein
LHAKSRFLIQMRWRSYLIGSPLSASGRGDCLFCLLAVHRTASSYKYPQYTQHAAAVASVKPLLACSPLPLHPPPFRPRRIQFPRYALGPPTTPPTTALVDRPPLASTAVSLDFPSLPALQPQPPNYPAYPQPPRPSRNAASRASLPTPLLIRGNFDR